MKIKDKFCEKSAYFIYKIKAEKDRPLIYNLFNQTPELKKLFEFAAENNILLFFGKNKYQWTFIQTNVGNRKRNFIRIGMTFLKPGNLGIAELFFVHELGHFIQYNRKNLSPEISLIEETVCPYRPRKKDICPILQEDLAWQEAFKIFGELGIDIRKKEALKIVHYCLDSHIKTNRLRRNKKPCFENFKCFNYPLFAGSLLKKFHDNDEPPPKADLPSKDIIIRQSP